MSGARNEDSKIHIPQSFFTPIVQGDSGTENLSRAHCWAGAHYKDCGVISGDQTHDSLTKKQWSRAKWREEKSKCYPWKEDLSAWGWVGDSLAEPWNLQWEPLKGENEVAPDRWYNMATCLRTNNAFFFRERVYSGVTSLWVLSKYWETWDSGGSLESDCECHSLNEPRSSLWKI